MSRLAVIMNPSAGHGKVGRRSAQIMMALRSSGHELVDLTAADAATAYHNAMNVTNVDALIVVGGDGIVHLGVNAAIHAGLPLGIIPLGSGNDAARALGIPANDLDAAITIITEALLEPPTPTDTIVAEFLNEAGEVSGHRHVMCSVVLGIDAAVNQRANGLKWPKGELRYIAAVFLELLKFRPYGYRIHSGGQEWDFPGTIVTIANTEFFGGGMRVAPGANPWDGRLRLLTAQAVSKPTILRIFPLIFSGRHIHHKKVTYREVPASAITVAPSAVGRPIPDVYADGELLGNAPMRFSIAQGSMLMLLPAKHRKRNLTP